MPNLRQLGANLKAQFHEVPFVKSLAIIAGIVAGAAAVIQTSWVNSRLAEIWDHIFDVRPPRGVTLQETQPGRNFVKAFNDTAIERNIEKWRRSGQTPYLGATATPSGHKAVIAQDGKHPLAQ
jgi:hypothetical protein